MLRRGEAIYIPEGHWHNVVAIEDESASVNLWYEDQAEMVKGKEEYLIRHCLKNLMEKRMKELLDGYNRVTGKKVQCTKELKVGMECIQITHFIRVRSSY